MKTSLALYKNELINFAKRENTVIHETKHAAQPLYIIHQYDLDEQNSDQVRHGCVFILYQKPNCRPHDSNRAIIEYRLVTKANEEKYVDLITIKLDEDYREMGLGTVLIKYFETKIFQYYFKDVQYIKGILIIGDRQLNRFFKKSGYQVVDNAFSKQFKCRTEGQKSLFTSFL